MLLLLLLQRLFFSLFLKASSSFILLLPPYESLSLKYTHTHHTSLYMAVRSPNPRVCNRKIVNDFYDFCIFYDLRFLKKIVKIVKTVKKFSQFHGKKAKKGWITRVLGAEKTAFENFRRKDCQSIETERSNSESTSDLSVMWKSFQCFLKLWQQTAWFSWSTTLSRSTVVFWMNSIKSFFIGKLEYMSIFLDWIVFFHFLRFLRFLREKMEKN